MRRMSGGAGSGGSQIFSIGKSKAKLFDGTKDTKVTFKDVAGLEGAKEEVKEIVDFLRNPTKYTKLGGKIPKGALLVGLPGTGKTLLAKAVAGEAKVPFFSLSGSDFVEMFVGVGASRVRDLFKQAKEKSPSIIFIDEVDAIGRARGKNSMTGSNDERENTLNQLLTEMDGFGTNTNVIVMAATNRADVLDKALMRAGRFDRQIYVDLPDVRERKEIFEVHLKPLKKAKGLDVEFLSKQTSFLTLSDADISSLSFPNNYPGRNRLLPRVVATVPSKRKRPRRDENVVRTLLYDESVQMAKEEERRKNGLGRVETNFLWSYLPDMKRFNLNLVIIKE